MKNTFYLPVILLFGFLSVASCMKKATTCRCNFQNGDRKNYELRNYPNDMMIDSCNVLNQQAVVNNGSCLLK
ncbi:MAG: hypothetical protein ACO1N0_00550 [Fluviicola sp.]